MNWLWKSCVSFRLIVFKNAKREVNAMHKEFKNCIIESSTNASVNTELTQVWVSKVFGSFSFRPRHLVWDFYEFYMQQSILFPQGAQNKSGKTSRKLKITASACYCLLDHGSMERNNKRCHQEIFQNVCTEFVDRLVRRQYDKLFQKRNALQMVINASTE